MMLTPLMLALLLWFCATPAGPDVETSRTVATVTVSPDSMVLNVGEIGRATCEPRNKFGTLLTNTCTWLARDTTLAKPTSGSQTSSITAKKVGSTWVVATSTKKDSLQVRVVNTVTPPAPGVTIAAGESIQAKVDANPPRTLFRLLAGTHVRQSVVPKTGDQFRCAPGAVMDGENVTNYAFQITAGAPYPDSVAIVGCKITRYHPPDGSQMAAIRGSGDTPTTSGRGWIVDSNEVSYSSQVGVRVGHYMKVRGNNVHHNGTFGISGPGDSVLVEGNKIDDNGDPAHVKESGGTKFVLTHDLIVRGNTLKRNLGPGLWPDIANRNFLIESNAIDSNYSEGIAVEISYDGKILNNTVTRSGLKDPRITAWPWGAAINISASGGTGIEVRGNRLDGNAYGIALIQQARGTNHPQEPAGIDPEMYVQNVAIRENTITLGPGSRGAIDGVDDTGRPNSLYSGRNITSDSNTVALSGVAYPFAWANGWRSLTQWRSYGFDLNSVVTP